MTIPNIVITGEGIVCAIGIGKEQVTESLLQLRSGIGEMRYIRSCHHELPVGEVKMSNEDMKSLLGIPVDKEVSRTTLMGMLAVGQAITEAGLRRCSRHRIVLISGTTVAGMDITERKFGDMMVHGVTDNSLEHHDSGSCTADIANHFGIFTDYTTISTACSSAANALILGADMLRHADADIVVAGGTEALSCFHLNGFNSLMILDHSVCRPFDKTRAGLNLGEGAAYVVLEREADAVGRNADIDAWLTGYGNACDAYHQTASSPEGTGAQIAMRQALNMSGLNKENIQWVHAHGTGTPDNDKSESNAIQQVFEGSVPPVSSTKAFTGHTTSASGCISVVISMIAMKNGFIPSNLGFHVAMDDGITPSTGIVKMPLHSIMINSFGFGGNDTSLVISDTNVNNGSESSKSSIDIKIEEVARVDNKETDALKDIKNYVRPMEARRMGKLMKSTLLTSLQALERAGIKKPDAIITGTAWGSLEYSEQLLRQMAGGDDMIKPTYFMQSTHNTIGSLVAIHLKCHGYNITFTQGDKSWQWAVYQAKLLLRMGRCKTVLVGCHDESTPLFNEFLRQMGKPQLPPVHSVAVVLKAK